MKKKKNRPAAADIAATTTSKDWGLGHIPGKGGKCTNSLIGDTMIHRELKEKGKN